MWTGSLTAIVLISCGHRAAEMKQTVHQSRTPVWGLAANGEELWRWSRAKSTQMGKVHWRRCSPLLLQPPTPLPSLGSAVPPVASSRRIRHCSWNISVNTDEEGQRAAVSSVYSAAPALHPPPPCHAIASSLTKWEMHSLTASNLSACTQNLPLVTAGTMMIRVLWTVLHQHLPPPRGLKRRTHWAARCAVNDLRRHQIWIRTSELTVWPLSAQETQGKLPKTANTCRRTVSVGGKWSALVLVTPMH